MLRWLVRKFPRQTSSIMALDVGERPLAATQYHLTVGTIGAGSGNIFNQNMGTNNRWLTGIGNSFRSPLGLGVQLLAA